METTTKLLITAPDDGCAQHPSASMLLLLPSVTGMYTMSLVAAVLRAGGFVVRLHYRQCTNGTTRS